MAAECTDCSNLTRPLSDVLADLSAVRALLHLAFHSPSLTSGLRDAMESLATAEAELHGSCFECALREALDDVERELVACAQATPSRVRPHLVEVLEVRQARSERRSRGLRLVRDAEVGHE